MFHIAEVARRWTEPIVTLTSLTSNPHVNRIYAIYPHWDIEDAFVVTQTLPNMTEKFVKWAIPMESSHRSEFNPENYH